MARHVRKRRSIRWGSVVSFLFVSSLCLFFVTNVFLRIENTKLTREIQTTREQITATAVQNEALSAEVKGLQNRERVVSIAENAGLTLQNNVVTIRQGE